MSDVTGPISTLPGAGHRVPDGMECDYHPGVPATARIQGETDSMGCEMEDLCDPCAKARRAQMSASRAEARCGKCDWCKKEATDLREARDYEEGMNGPVYRVCGSCIKCRDDRIAEENERYDYYNATDYDGEYE